MLCLRRMVWRLVSASGPPFNGNKVDKNIDSGSSVKNCSIQMRSCPLASFLNVPEYALKTFYFY